MILHGLPVVGSLRERRPGIGYRSHFAAGSEAVRPPDLNRDQPPALRRMDQDIQSLHRSFGLELDMSMDAWDSRKTPESPLCGYFSDNVAAQ